jgi:cysteine desulfurase
MSATSDGFQEALDATLPILHSMTKNLRVKPKATRTSLENLRISLPPSFEKPSETAGATIKPTQPVTPFATIASVKDDGRLAKLEMATENDRIRMLRDRLYRGINAMEEVYINGDMEQRVPHNLNASFNYVEGESLIMAVKDLAVSSGSACTSASLEPSYVLRALGRSDELAHSSIRFSVGRFTTEQEVDFAVDLLRDKVGRLREMSPLWEMVKDGVDLNTVQWSAH